LALMGFVYFGSWAWTLDISHDDVSLNHHSAIADAGRLRR